MRLTTSLIPHSMRMREKPGSSSNTDLCAESWDVIQRVRTCFTSGWLLHHIFKKGLSLCIAYKFHFIFLFYPQFSVLINGWKSLVTGTVPIIVKKKVYVPVLCVEKPIAILLFSECTCVSIREITVFVIGIRT